MRDSNQVRSAWHKVFWISKQTIVLPAWGGVRQIHEVSESTRCLSDWTEPASLPCHPRDWETGR